MDTTANCPGTGSLKTVRVTGDLWCPTCYLMFLNLTPGAEVRVPAHPVKAAPPAPSAEELAKAQAVIAQWKVDRERQEREAAEREANRYQPRHGVPVSKGDGLKEAPWKYRNE